MIYEDLCIEQEETIETLVSQVCRLLKVLEQYTNIEEEEARLKETEKRAGLCSKSISQQ